MAWTRRRTRKKRMTKRMSYGAYLADKLSRARKASSKRMWKMKIARAINRKR